jgi:type III secretory pathway component EscR
MVGGLVWSKEALGFSPIIIFYPLSLVIFLNFDIWKKLLLKKIQSFQKNVNYSWTW